MQNSTRSLKSCVTSALSALFKMLYPELHLRSLIASRLECNLRKGVFDESFGRFRAITGSSGTTPNAERVSTFCLPHMASYERK